MICADCGSCDIEFEVEEGELPFCLECGSDELKQAESNEEKSFVVVGLIEELEEMQKKLKKLTINVGEDDSIQIVTNAPNVHKDDRVVVARIGASVTIDGKMIDIKK